MVLSLALCDATGIKIGETLAHQAPLFIGEVIDIVAGRRDF